ncbi:riboflavin kinase [Paramarasmius palmivorus]|uniref:Riboflavin kinase n=1 Tax=Paramarasmius palmivorus TaxID=297713 RepID=A0AAW0D868_9AGAR
MAGTRPLTIGPSTGPEAPYPRQMEGKVIKGFRRGSNDLGIPTANLPVDNSLTPWITETESGVYFGWASLRLPPSHPDHPTASDTTTTTTSEARFSIYPMVMSIGYNPFFGNTVRSAEVHILHEFRADFYDVEMRLLIMGFIREQKNYLEIKALIEDIKVDCDVARKSLDREAWALRETGEGTMDGSSLMRETSEQTSSVV